MSVSGVGNINLGLQKVQEVRKRERRKGVKSQQDSEQCGAGLEKLKKDIQSQ